MSELADEFNPEDAALADDIVQDLDPGDEATPEATETETPAEPEAPTPEAPAWTGPSQEEWQQIAGVVSYLGNVIAEAQKPEPPPPVEYDPTDPNSLVELVSRTVQETIAPLVPALQATQERDAVTKVEGWLDEAASTLVNQKLIEAPEQLDREAAANVAYSFLSVAQGNPQLAVQKAAEYVAARDKQLSEQAAAAAVEAYKNELKGISDAPRDLSGSGAPATEVVSFEKGQDELSVARQIAERIRLGATG